jgi:hypothetical protein
MGAWGAEIPLQDLMGYTRTDFTVATGAPEPPPPPPRSEERNEAALSIGLRGTAGAAECCRHVQLQWRSKRSAPLS